MNDEIKSTILVVLHDMGFIIFENSEDDINLQNYITDSLQFVDFIVRLEDKYDIMFSDEFYDYNLLASTDGLCEMIDDFLKKMKRK